jgi:predicted RNA binding protein YcfA (HicA-like mRNA interferase family)
LLVTGAESESIKPTTIKQDKIIPVGTLKSIEKQANLVLVESRVY